MNKQSFIDLLNQCKAKALRALNDELRISAALLISNELKTDINEYEKTMIIAKGLYSSIEKAAVQIKKDNGINKNYYYNVMSEPSC